MIKIEDLVRGQKIWKKYSNGHIQGFIVSTDPYPNIYSKVGEERTAKNKLAWFTISDEPYIEVYLDFDDDDYVECNCNLDVHEYFYTREELE